LPSLFWRPAGGGPQPAAFFQQRRRSDCLQFPAGILGNDVATDDEPTPAVDLPALQTLNLRTDFYDGRLDQNAFPRLQRRGAVAIDPCLDADRSDLAFGERRG